MNLLKVCKCLDKKKSRFFQSIEAEDSILRASVKPSFVAPSQPLEKSLKEHIQRTAGLTPASTVASEAEAVVSGKDKRKKKEKRRSKETSPSDVRIGQTVAAAQPSASVLTSSK